MVPRWVFWMVLTLLSWGLWAVLSKKIGGASPEQIQALSTLGMLPILAALWTKRGAASHGDRRRGVWLAFGSGIVSVLGNVAYFAALADEKAATIVSLTAMFPAVTVLLAVPVLRERMTPLQWAGIGLSLVAIWLFFPPGEQRGMAAGMLYALLAIVLWGVTLLMQKMSTDDISGEASAYWFIAAFAPVGVALAIWDPLPREMIPGLSTNGPAAVKLWLLAAAIGFTLGLGNLTILNAFASGGKAAIIAPLAGLYPLVSIPLAVVWLEERIGRREGWGIALALAAVVMLSYSPAPTDAGASTRGE